MTYERISKLSNLQRARLLRKAAKLKAAGGPPAEQAAQVMAWIAEFVARRDGLLTEAQIGAAKGFWDIAPDGAHLGETGVEQRRQTALGARANGNANR